MIEMDESEMSDTPRTQIEDINWYLVVRDILGEDLALLWIKPWEDTG